MEYRNIILEKQGEIATITLNRPKALNASNRESVTELHDAVLNIEADKEIRAVVITGGSKVFAAGGDLKYFSTADPLDMEDFIGLCHKTHDTIANSAKPYVAAIANLALGGGCELALACDIRIASAGTIIGLPEITLGIIPGAGGTQRLSRIIGGGWARHLVLTGDVINAETAQQIGLVSKLVPLDELMPAALQIAQNLAAKSPLAMRSAKKCLNTALDADLAAGLAYEQKSWAFLYCSEDQTEGMTAFLEKRPPVFKGK